DVVDPLACRTLDLRDHVAVEEIRLAQARAPPVVSHLAPLVEAAASVGACVVDLERVELACRPVAPEVAGVGIVDPGPAEQIAELRQVLLAHLLLDAVRSETRDPAANEQPRLVDRVA